MKVFSILVAEDEYHAAMDLTRELTQRGAAIVGPAASLERTLQLIECSHIDGAILDINLGGEMIFVAADVLRKRGIPFIFATGYDPSVIPKRFDEVIRCEKPIGSERLVEALADILSLGHAML